MVTRWIVVVVVVLVAGALVVLYLAGLLGNAAVP